MKGNRTYMDIGAILDEVFEAAKDFGDKINDEFGKPGCMPGFGPHGPKTWFEMGQDENADRGAPEYDRSATLLGRWPANKRRLLRADGSHGNSLRIYSVVCEWSPAGPMGANSLAFRAETWRRGSIRDRAGLTPLTVPR